jgi:hypothetical protein
MVRHWRLFALCALLGIVSGSSFGDDKDAPVKGRLPTYWNKLGLSEDQKLKVFKVQTDFHDKTIALEKQLKDLKEKEKGELEQILSDEQKKRLREMLLSKGPADPKDKMEKDDPKTEKK